MRTDYEEALLKVSDALRRHNKPAGGISSRKACELILEAVRPKSEWLYKTGGIEDTYGRCGRCDCTVHLGKFCSHCGAKMEM